MSREPNDAIPETPRGRRFGPLAIVIAVVASAVLTAGGMHLARHRPHAATPAATKTEMYQCPMHPSIVRDRPGDCPICGMKLVKVEGDPGPGRADEHRHGQTAPPPAVKGLAVVEIDPARQQLIGLRTVEATRGKVGGTWRTVGRVAIDETRVRHVNVKVSGFVEHIHVDFVGKTVKKGDPLFSIYSPELLAAQEEFLLALRTRGALTAAGGASGDGEALVQAARRKLALWDIPQSEIERIARTGETKKSLTVYSPASGVVTKKEVVDGMKLDAGAMPYEIVDLSSVWVLADVYESELRLVKQGMAATLTLKAFPGKEFRGRVVFIDPLLDPKTRTVKVRLTFPNPHSELRPEMFGEVVLHGAPHEGLTIPEDAVVDSGTEKIVFVALGEGKLAPRKVRLGDADGTIVEVIEGLQAGERVATRANFLIDSESRLRAALAELATPPGDRKAPEKGRVLPDLSAPPGASP